jgi:DNA-binding MarR family transcriptional regulator
VTEYLGLTKGTVSQSLKVLENKALIYKEKDKDDLRITHLKVTDEGKQFLAETCPPRKFTQAIEQLSESKQSQAAVLMQEILKNYQKAVGRTAFGVCNNCKFNQKNAADSVFCGLTKETLSFDDTQLICREYAT